MADPERMNRRSVLGAALVAISIVAGSRALPGAAAQDVTWGTIDQVDTARSSLVLRTDAGDARAARLTPLTRVTIDGMPGDVRDLRPGQRVDVHFAMTRGGAARLDVVRIDVHTRPRPPG